MPRKEKHLFWILGAIVAVLLLLIGLTRVFTIVDAWHFEGETSQEIGNGIKASVRVDSKTRVAFMGLLAKSTSPYDLVIGLYTDKPETTLREASFEQVTIRYQNGERVNLLGPQDERFSPFMTRKSSNWESDGIVYHESIATGFKFTNCIGKNVPFTIECKGKLIGMKGERLPIKFEWSFQPKKLLGVAPNYILDSEVMDSDLPKP